MAGTQIINIADCTEVQPGFALKARLEHSANGVYQVILGKHLADSLDRGQPYRYSAQDAQRISPQKSLDKYKVYPGDVLFVSRGNNNHACVVESVPDPTIASATFYILRPHAGIDPSFLAWCLNQIPIQAQIRRIRTEAGTPIVQRKLFEELPLPIPSVEMQRKLADLGTLMAKESSLLQQQLEKTKHLHHELGKKLLQQILFDADKKNTWSVNA